MPLVENPPPDVLLGIGRLALAFAELEFSLTDWLCQELKIEDRGPYHKKSFTSKVRDLQEHLGERLEAEILVDLEELAHKRNAMFHGYFQNVYDRKAGAWRTKFRNPAGSAPFEELTLAHVDDLTAVVLERESQIHFQIFKRYL